MIIWLEDLVKFNKVPILKGDKMPVVQKVVGMSFSEALVQLKSGKAIARHEWAAMDREYLFLVNTHEDDGCLPPDTVVTKDLYAQVNPSNFERLPAYVPQAWIGKRDACGSYRPWSPTHGDLLEADWYVINDIKQILDDPEEDF